MTGRSTYALLNAKSSQGPCGAFHACQAGQAGATVSQEHSSPLEAVDRTTELARRPQRTPDYEAEGCAVTALLRALAVSSGAVLQELTDALLRLCAAHSAGVSILERRAEGAIFRWHAVAGHWAPYLWNTMPRDGSPCGTVVDRDAPLLLERPERHYAIPPEMTPPIVEVLLVPFHVDGDPAGTLWIVSHDASRRFDREDVRVVTNLADVASTAYRLSSAQQSLQRRERDVSRVLDSITDAVHLVDAGWVLTYMNASARRMLADQRIDPARVIGARYLDTLFSEARGTAFEREVARAMRDRTTAEFEYLHDPWRRCLAVRVYAVDDGGLAVYLQDVTDRTDAEAALRRQLQITEAITSNADVSLFIMDEHQHCVFMNPAAVRLTGYMLDEMKGRPLHDVIHHTRPDGTPYPIAECPIDRAFPENNREQGEDVFVHRDGHFYEVAYTASPLREGDVVRGTIVEVRDITERKRAEQALAESRQRLLATYERAPIGIVETAPDGRFINANEEFCRLLGYHKHELLGLGMLDVIWADDRDRELALHAHLVAGPLPFCETDVRYVRKDGAIVWAETRRTVVRDGSGAALYTIAAVNDVTERRAAEQALRRSEERLKDADRRKDEFLAVLAHELRNPLAPIRTGLELLRLAGGAPEAVSRVRSTMERQVGHMVRLIDDLLDVSRITSGKIHLQRRATALAEIVQSAVETNRASMAGGNLHLTVRLPEETCLLDVDPTRAVQIVANLLHNAVKFTPSGGRIDIAAEIREDDAERRELVLSVADTGAGISPALLPRVFDLFIQGHEAGHRAHGGLGIGLALARQLVELHGGRIDAASDGPGCGSSFVVHLPLAARVPADAKEDSAASASAMRRRRVVVVDDNVDAADMLAMLIHELGGDARSAHDGESGIACIREFSPDIVLLDIGLPDFDGYEVCRRLRQEPCGAQALVIAITGWGQHHDKRRALDAGFDAHLTKPADPETLGALLTHAGRGRRHDLGPHRPPSS
jgi:PAS domain S-box-containing protein